MATNPHFNNVGTQKEQDLVEDLVVETIKIHGLDMIYLPRTLVNEDLLFGEDTISKFTDFGNIEMFLESVDGFEGDGDFITRFGLEIRDSATFVVSKRRFTNEIGQNRPLEGDLLYLPLTGGLFEIKFVELESPFFQLGKNYTFKLMVELFQYSEETIETGYTEIDNIIDDVDYDIILTVGEANGTGVFAKGDLVYQPSGGSITGDYTSSVITGTVEENRTSSNKLVITDVAGKWQQSTSSQDFFITKSDNSLYAKVTGFGDSLDEDKYNSNSDIETEADSILDFTETNPFGEA